MTSKRNTLARWCLALVLVLPALACNLSEAPIAAESQQSGADSATATQDPNGGTASTDTPEPTVAPTETITPTATETPVTMTAGQTLSCVKGPHWALYEWVTSIPEGETVTLLARNEPGGDPYYYAHKSDGKECWAFGGSSTFTGDPTSLPIQAAPPLPTIQFTVENQIHIPICTILIREEDETSWGANRLSAALAHGATFTLSMTAGYYDVQITPCAGPALYEKYDTPIGADAGTRTVVIDTVVHVFLHNAAPFSICRVRFNPADGSGSFDVRGASADPIPHGDNVPLTAPVGVYTMDLFQCGAAVPFVSGTPLNLLTTLEGATLV
jgi:hypothetical protein